jgi:hypothetical protein
MKVEKTQGFGMAPMKMEGSFVSYEYANTNHLRIIRDENKIVKTLDNREVHRGDHTDNK